MSSHLTTRSARVPRSPHAAAAASNVTPMPGRRVSAVDDPSHVEDRHPLVVAVANEAGSVGKTSTAVTMAALLAAAGHAVRLVDLDPQSNATWWLGVGEGAAFTSGDVLMRRCGLDAAAVDTEIDGLSLVPSSRALTGTVNELARGLGPEQRLRLALADSNPAEVTIIDCPGSLGPLTLSALVAATTVVTVTTPSAKEVAGIWRVMETVREVAAVYNPGLRVSAIVPCTVPPPSAGRLYSAALDHLNSAWPGLLTSPVRRSVRVPEAYAARSPLHVHAPTAGVTDDYREALVDLGWGNAE